MSAPISTAAALHSTVPLYYNTSFTNFSYLEGTEMMKNSTEKKGPIDLGTASDQTIFGLSFFFLAIGIVGLLGNFLVIYVVLTDRRMRKSVTNLFITNLAISDALIMIFGSPDIVQFMLNKGWQLGVQPCKVLRYVMVFSLYASVITQVAVCVERCIAIVNPIKAHILCSRRRILMVICCLWPVALTFGLPTPLFNTVGKPHPRFPIFLCALRFPGNHMKFFMAYKYSECLTFFFIPVVIQVVLYTIMGKKLFLGADNLRRNTGSNARLTLQGDNHRERDSEALRARKGVVKMLIASVVVYFISYLPPQVPLIYNTFSSIPFKTNWHFHALMMTMGFINSAANPIFYAIFSQKFRRKFAQTLCKCVSLKSIKHPPFHSNETASTRTNIKFTSLKATNHTLVTSTCM